MTKPWATLGRYSEEKNSVPIRRIVFSEFFRAPWSHGHIGVFTHFYSRRLFQTSLLLSCVSRELLTLLQVFFFFFDLHGEIGKCLGVRSPWRRKQRVSVWGNTKWLLVTVGHVGIHLVSSLENPVVDKKLKCWYSSGIHAHIMCEMVWNKHLIVKKSAFRWRPLDLKGAVES